VTVSEKFQISDGLKFSQSNKSETNYSQANIDRHTVMDQGKHPREKSGGHTMPLLSGNWDSKQ